jgi:membrane protease YdiL (CAAX protease family)
MNKTVGLLALGMFAWGAAKAFAVGPTLGDKKGHKCPLCTQQAVMEPKHLIHSLVTGPVVEEIQFRHQLPKLLGENVSNAAFGALHVSRKLTAEENAARVLEAGLAGALIYAKAYDSGGLAGATLVHAAHNLGADLGLFSVMGKEAARKGYRHVTTRRQLQPGVTLSQRHCMRTR